MRNILLLFTLIFSTLGSFAQSPNLMSYQATVRNAAGALVAEKPAGFQLQILKQTGGGSTPVFQQEIIVNTNKNGLATLSIGTGGTISLGSIAAIDWEQGPYALKVSIDPEGGNNYTISNSSEIMSVPYALNSKYAQSSGSTLDKTYRVGTADQIGKITADKGPVSIEGKDGFLVKGITGQGAVIPNYTGSGYQPKMFFNPKKGAFRAGNISNNDWDDANVGEESAAFGRGPLASGGSSFATGVFTKATGFTSLATGNSTEASGYISTAMGYFSKATGYGSFSLGRSSIASGEYSTALGYYTKAIGDKSTAMGDSSESRGLGTLAFGHKNIATGPYSIAMGYGNATLGNYSIAMGYGSQSTKAYNVALGFQNIASGYYEGSTAIGYQNTASGDGSTALGLNSDATGKWSTAIGRFNTASGQSSFAIGNNSSTKATYSGSLGTANIVNSAYSIAIGNKITVPSGMDGAIVLADNIAGKDMSLWLQKNSLAGRFAGGVMFFSSSNLSSGVYLLPGNNSWSTVSDSTKKENFLPVDGKDFLNKISTMKLVSWNYKGQDPKAFRHYGPMAQEFYAHFGNDKLGKIGNDTTISSTDFAGVSFIAIQALIKENEANTSQIRNLKEENIALKTDLSAIKNQYETALTNLEKKYENLNKIIASLNVQRSTTIEEIVKKN